MRFNTIQEAVEDLKQGKMIILVDDEDRENEGDLVVAAEMVTPEVINFMAREGRGLICLTLTPERAEAMNLSLMTSENTAPFGTAFTISIDAAEKISTGISAADRARTIQVAIHPESQPSDLVRPGHVFPIKAQPGGCLSAPDRQKGLWTWHD
jgi:3,4-dihydroxy 2-butanone 4-phosphate synthase/GTP cyclohydrolase II